MRVYREWRWLRSKLEWIISLPVDRTLSISIAWAHHFDKCSLQTGPVLLAFFLNQRCISVKLFIFLSFLVFLESISIYFYIYILLLMVVIFFFFFNSVVSIILCKCFRKLDETEIFEKLSFFLQTIWLRNNTCWKDFLYSVLSYGLCCLVQCFLFASVGPLTQILFVFFVWKIQILEQIEIVIKNEMNGVITQWIFSLWLTAIV